MNHPTLDSKTNTSENTHVEPTFVELLDGARRLSNAELDERLENAAKQNETSEMELCAYLSEVRERNAHREFGYTSIYDYARERFTCGERKTRYLISLGRKIKELPKLRQAMKERRIGWCKASRLTSVVTPANEGMWLDSALSLTVTELESRIKDGTDSEVSALHFWLTAEQRHIWEGALEIFRRRAGSEISPVEAFEYMAAEVVAQWGDDLKPLEPAVDELKDGEEVTAARETEHDRGPMPADSEEAKPHVQPVDPSSRIDTEGQRRLFDEHVARGTDVAIPFAKQPTFDDIRTLVLERDGWKCTYPGCNERRHLHVHHVRFRSRGGGHELGNLTVVCEFHHGSLHREEIQVRGHAPFALEWTPPKLMRQALARRRSPEVERKWSLPLPT